MKTSFFSCLWLEGFPYGRFHVKLLSPLISLFSSSVKEEKPKSVAHRGREIVTIKKLITMRKTFLFTLALTFVAGVAFSQSKSDLKGPKAKNYKIWKDDGRKESVAVVSAPNSKKRITGPAAKNRKLWQKSAQPQTYFAVNFPGPNRLKGPKAKNFKRWQAERGSLDKAVVQKMRERKSEETNSIKKQ